MTLALKQREGVAALVRRPTIALGHLGVGGQLLLVQSHKLQLIQVFRLAECLMLIKRFCLKTPCFIGLLLVMVTCGMTGCGSDDFAKPPGNLAEIRERAKTKAQAKPEDNGKSEAPAETVNSDQAAQESAGVDPGATEGERSARMPEGFSGGDDDVKKGSAGGNVDTANVGANGNSSGDSLSGKAGAGDTLNAIAVTDFPDGVAGTAKSMDDNHIPRKTSPANRDAAAKVVGQDMAADGKVQAQTEEDNVKETSVIGAGKSLLDKLTASGDEKKKQPQGRVRVQQTITRTGRMAVAAESWFRLRNQLAKRFYVAATSDGAKIAATSGERSLGIVSTRIEILGEELNWARLKRTVAAVVTERKEVTTQPVTGLPGIATALELIDDGNTVLVGTEDGRLLARSSGSLQDWDVYAQDLFGYQDQFRPATRISDSAVVVVRALNRDRLLTVDADGTALIWDMGVVVNEPINPLDMTVEQARSPEAPTVSAEHIAKVDLPRSRILSLTLSRSGKYALAVTSDERVTVFQTDDGRVTGSLSAAQFDDTQPVCALLEEKEKRVLAGLADGRIVRRALPGGTAVSGMTDEGGEVDYEVVFAPDTTDRDGAVTSLELVEDGSLLYIGRLSGIVAQFDLPRKQFQSSQKLHSGPVLEMRSTAAGLFSVGDDRVAKLSYIPTVGNRREPGRTFRPPNDVSLKDKEVIERPESMKQDKFTVRRNFDRPVSTASQQDVTLAGIRSPDPVIALYEHQLRVAADEKVRAGIRSSLARVRQPAARTEAKPSYADANAVMVAELPSEFDFQSRPLRRVVMTLSDDGSTLAAAQYYRNSLLRGPAPHQPVIVWDTSTGTKLRTWRRSPGVLRLAMDLEQGLLLPTPFSARLNLYSGEFRREQAPSLSAQQSATGEWLAVGLKGSPGVASNVLSLIGRGAVESRSGLEAFEGAVPAVAWSQDGTSLFVSLRERTRTRLMELEVPTLGLRHEIDAETLEGRWDIDNVDLETGSLGPTFLWSSPTGRLLVTCGRYSGGEAAWRFAIWQKSGERWGEKPQVVVSSAKAILETEMTDTQLTFVNGQEAQIAVVGPEGVGVINTRTGRVDDTLPLPDVGNRRPVTVLSSDGKWVMAGDNEGNVWVWDLRSIKRRPKKFLAQAGPIIGLAISPNSRFLATAGEENRVRVWDLGPMLSPPVRSASR